MKLTQDEKEVMEAVEKLNEEIYDKIENPTEYPVSIPAFDYNISLNEISVSFFTDDYDNPQTLVIYNSESELRIYDEDSDTYENYYDCFIRLFNEVVESLNNIKI